MIRLPKELIEPTDLGGLRMMSREIHKSFNPQIPININHIDDDLLWNFLEVRIDGIERTTVYKIVNYTD